MSLKSHHKPRLLTGDTPTGRMHLGHWVGSMENRVAMQDKYDCYFLIANAHAFTTRVDEPLEIRQSTLNIAMDNLAVGIDPNKSTLFIESDVPAIFELAALFSMLIPYPRLMRNPTIKDEIRDKKLGGHYSVGFLFYPILQIADILAFRPDIVPVGEDQTPHVELTREVARRFNQLYCGIDPRVGDKDCIKAGGILPVIEGKIGRVRRLVGIGGPSDSGQLLKMSKSLNNAIFLSDHPDIIRKKVMSMYTDPKRIHASDPGTVDNNPLWIFHDTFNPDKKWIQEAKQRYREGKIGDVECKELLVEIVLEFVRPIQQRRVLYEKDPGQVLGILKKGAQRANVLAQDTLSKVKEAMQQLYS